MAERKRSFRSRIPWLRGDSVPARAPVRPAAETPPVVAEPIPFPPITRPPTTKVPSPPRKASQPPSPPRTAPDSSLPLRSTLRPEEVVQPETAFSPPAPSRPEVPSGVASQLHSTGKESLENNLKSKPAETVLDAAQPKETLPPSTTEPQPANEKPAKPVTSASLLDLIKADPPKALPSILLETSSLTPVPQPSLDLQPTKTLLPSPVERLAADEKPEEPLASVPDLAKANPSRPSSPEREASSPHSLETSSLSAVTQPSFESRPRETLLPPPAPLESSTLGPVSQPKLDSINGSTSKPQKDNGIVVADKEEAPIEAARPVTGSEKRKEKETTHPLTVVPVPEKQPQGPLPSASSSHEAKRSKKIKLVPTRVAKESSHQSDTTPLSSDFHPKPAAVRGSSSSFQKEIKEDVSKLVHLITSGKANTSMVEESVDVITLAGENTGATMQLTPESSKKKEHIHIRRNYRSDPDESVEDTTDVEEDDREISQGEGEESENSAFVNSNVQGVNNSVALDSSVSDGSPGVHFELSLKAELLLESRSNIGSSEAYSDQFNVTPTEKRTYEPNIRRRCLRGLFLESSDSDDDGKPRRHGCRFSCGQKVEEKHVDVE